MFECFGVSEARIHEAVIVAEKLNRLVLRVLVNLIEAIN